MNDFGESAGYYGAGGNFPPSAFGFIWGGSSVESFQFPGGLFTYASGVNNQGQIVGTYESEWGVRGFLLSPGGIFTSMLFPGAAASQVWDINDSGAIVGDYGESNQDYTPNGFLFDAGVYYTLDYPGSVQTQVFGINDLGQMVGQYEAQNGNYYGFLATPCSTEGGDCIDLQQAAAISTPEPRSLALLATVIAILSLLAFRSKVQAVGVFYRLRLRRAFRFAWIHTIGSSGRTRTDNPLRPANSRRRLAAPTNERVPARFELPRPRKNQFRGPSFRKPPLFSGKQRVAN